MYNNKLMKKNVIYIILILSLITCSYNNDDFLKAVESGDLNEVEKAVSSGAE